MTVIADPYQAAIAVSSPRYPPSTVTPACELMAPNASTKNVMVNRMNTTSTGRLKVVAATVIYAVKMPPHGRLLAENLGQVSKDQVWRVMRKHDLHLERRQSWCVSTDPEFSRKAADVVGLYLNPPENALVLCIDEKPCIQALERAQGWIRLPNGRALSGFTHEYKRHGTTTLFAALNVASGLVHAGHYRRRRRREFLDFMNELISKYPDKELHVVLDNLNTHKPKEDRWLKAHPNVHLHFIPTHSSWLNQIECWFSILSRSSLRGASFTSVRMLVEAIEAFVASWNQKATPFEWTKAEVHQQQIKRYYSDLRN